MRYTGSTRIEGSNPSRSAFSFYYKGSRPRVAISPPRPCGCTDGARVPTKSQRRPQMAYSRRMLPAEGSEPVLRDHVHRTPMTNRRGRRSNGEGSIRQRPNGRWEARFAAVDSAGKLHRRSYFAATRVEAERELRAALTQRDAGTMPPGPRETVAHFLQQWLTGSRSRVRPRTWDRYEEHVRLHLVPALGRLPLGRIGPSDVQRMSSELIARGLSPATARRAHATLRAALQEAVRWHLIPHNPAALAAPPRVARREMAAFSPDEARRFLFAVHGTRHEALWVLALTTGLRQGELLALRWPDLELESGYLIVRGTLTRLRGQSSHAGESKSHQEITSPKTARSRRRVEFGALAADALHSHRVAQDAVRARAGSTWSETRLVFCGEHGQFIQPSSLNRELKGLLKQYGLPAIRFHDLRHTAATLLLTKDVNPKKVSELLGHSSVAITLDTYSHVLPGVHREVAAVMDNLLA
jgi:integrase